MIDPQQGDWDKNAALAASLFHSGDAAVPALKARLRAYSIEAGP